MNRNSITAVLLALGIAAASSDQAGDAASSVIPPGVLFEALAINRDLPTKAKPKYNSTTDLAVSPDKKTLFVAQQTAKRIDVVDLATEAVTGFIMLPNEVTGIAVSPASDLLYATCSSDRWPAGMVCVVDISTQNVTRTISVGHGARAPVVTPDGRRLFVCNRYANDLSVIDLASSKEIRKVEMVREPYCAAITPDGNTLVVGNLLPDDRSTDTSFISSMVTLVNVDAVDETKNIRLPAGSTGLTGCAVSPDGNYAFVTHTINRLIIGTTVEKGWLSKNEVSIIDLTTREYLNTVMLDKSSMGKANPWGIAFTEDQRYLCITHAGSHDLSIIDYPTFMDTVAEYTKQGATLLWHYSNYTNREHKIVEVNGRCPRALAVVDNTVYTAGYFDDEGAAVYTYTLSGGSVQSSKIPVGTPVPQTVHRQGEAYFYDAGLCFQEWHSCHTCHLFTRVSGLNRILGGGAIVAPKNTRSMLYSWWTPPTMWTGRRGVAQQSIVAGVELECFRAAIKDFTVPLDTFIMALKPVSSPWLEKGRLSEAAERGRMLFLGDKAQCSRCHAGPLFTDCKFWNANVPDPFDANTEWVTPSLVEAWRTGPYGHLGSFWGVREMIELPGHNEAATKLTLEEMDDLVAYVLSL